MTHTVSELMRAVAMRKGEDALALLNDKNVSSHINDVDIHGNRYVLGLPFE